MKITRPSFPNAAKIKQLILVTLLTVIILLLFYPKLILHPNSFLFSTYADGVYNYFNYAYHIKHDLGFLSFTGMNYPYGEYIQYVDCFPALSSFLKLFSGFFPDIINYSVGIYNICMILSIILSVIFTFLILCNYNMKGVAGITGSLGIVFLCSQPLLWWLGHYALSIVCFIPVTWYLFLLQNRHPERKILVFITALNSLFWFFVHNYLGFIVVSFLLFANLFDYLLSDKKKDKLFKLLKNLFAYSIIPALITFGLSALLNTHTGRIELPYQPGYKASFYSVFIPNHSFTRPLYDLIFDLSPQTDQYWCKIGNYIGLPANLFLIAVTCYFSFMIFIKKKHKVIKQLIPSEISPFLISSIILLLFAMAIPFQYGLEWILDYIPIIKQITTIGRVAWVFYFVFNVYMFLVINKIQSGKIKKLLLIAVSIIMFFESFGNHLYLKNLETRSENLFSEKLENEFMQKIKDISFEKYQAILTLPFHHAYITAHDFQPTDKSMNFSMQLSFFTGLPMFATVLSRPSQTEARKILQLFAPAYYTKPIKKDLPDTKPVLIAYSKDSLTIPEKTILEKSIIIFENHEFILSELNVDSFFIYDTNLIIQEYREISNKYCDDQGNAFIKDDTSLFFYYNDFENRPSPQSYRGKGAFTFKKREAVQIFSSENQKFIPGKKYILDFWYYSHLYDQSFNIMWTEVRDSSGLVVFSKSFDPIRPCKYDGDWVLNEVTFSVKDFSDKVYLYSGGGKYYSDSLFIDDLMIRDSQLNVYKTYYKEINETYIIKNNENIRINQQSINMNHFFL